MIRTVWTVSMWENGWERVWTPVMFFICYCTRMYYLCLYWINLPSQQPRITVIIRGAGKTRSNVQHGGYSHDKCLVP